MKGLVGGASATLTSGTTYTLDYKGDGTLTVVTVPTDATVTVEVDGEVNEAIAKYEDGVITIKGAADGADSNLTITATDSTGEYEFEAFELTLRVLEPTVESVTISGQADPAISNGTLTLAADYSKEYQLTAHAWPEADGQGTEITGKTFTWSSSDGEEKVIELGENGALTVKGPGEANVTVTCGGKSLTITVKVEPVLAEVKVYSDANKGASVSGSFTLNASGAGTLYVKPVLRGTDTPITDSLEWKVTLGDDDTTLTVGTDGLITISDAIDGEELKITASHANYDFGDGVTITLVAPVGVQFIAADAVYNKDLWGDTFAAEPQARFARMIGTVPTGTDLTQFDKISIKKSSGELIVNNAFATLYLTDGATTVSTWATSLRDAGLLASNKLPVCFMFDAMDAFEQGDYTITLTSFAGDTFTTWINVTQNDVEKNATWTAGSSSDLKIASIPTITNDLLVKLVSDLTLSQDGTKLLSGKGVTDILKADSTGNVYIKKEILDTLDAGTYSISFKAGDRSESFNFIVVDHRAAWGTPSSRLVDHKVQYIDSAGKTSIELTSENLANGILWLLEDSGGASAWYGIDLSTGAFELDKGSRFYVQWLHKDDAEYDTYYAQLDDEQKSQIENGWIFLIGVEDASGNKVQPESPVKTYVQIGDDWDLDELKAYYIAAGDDQSVDVEDILGFAYPEGEDEFGMMMLSHFSPYLIMDELSDAEKIALGKGNNKTGDQAVQVAVAGLGSILVLALGIMLRLITSKKKFEE